MTLEPCAHRPELDDTSQEPCTNCLSFYKGLVNALILSGLAWGIILAVIYYVTG